MASEKMDWRSLGACASNEEANIWLAEEVYLKKLAQHVCLYHCPVLKECREYTESRECNKHPLELFRCNSVVQAGVIYSAKPGRPASFSPIKTCSICKGDVPNGKIRILGQVPSTRAA